MKSHRGENRLAHQVVEKNASYEQGHECIFWPNDNKDIETRVQKCEICQESQNTQAKETLKPHEVPTRLWQVVVTDLFSWNGLNIYSCVTISPNLPLSRKYQVDSPLVKQL